MPNNTVDEEIRQLILAVIQKHLREQDAQQLLRPSEQPTESDDILLRAAAYTDETPKDQLLRPSPTDEPTL